MTIEELHKYRIAPFEIGDQKLIKLFSFFLHLAPTISSKCALDIEEAKLNEIWLRYISNWSEQNYSIISSGTNIKNSISKCKLNKECTINCKSKGFVCKLKRKMKKVKINSLVYYVIYEMH